MFNPDRLVDIGKRIKDTREDMDMTQKELEQKAKLPSTSISKIENGTQSPTVEQIAKIANTLEVDIEYILGIDKDTDFIDDFMDLFVRLTTTKEYFANNGDVFKGEDLIFEINEDYLVLTGNDCVFTLIKEIAAIKNLKTTLLTDEYNHRLNAAKDRYKKSEAKAAQNESEENIGKSDEKSYFLISGEQMTKIIELGVINKSYVDALFKKISTTEPLWERPLSNLKLNKKNEQK